MNSQMSVTSTESGQHQVVDASGHLIAGPFATNAEAWSALDVLAGDVGQPRRVRPIKPKSTKSHRRGKERRYQKEKLAEKHDAKFRNPNVKLTKKQRRQMATNASKAVTWIRDIATSKYDPIANRAYRNTRLGPMGAASEVRKIDPSEYSKIMAGLNDKA